MQRANKLHELLEIFYHLSPLDRELVLWYARFKGWVTPAPVPAHWIGAAP